MFEFEGLVDDVVLGEEKELEHFLLVKQELAA